EVRLHIRISVLLELFGQISHRCIGVAAARITPTVYVFRDRGEGLVEGHACGAGVIVVPHASTVTVLLISNASERIHAVLTREVLVAAPPLLLLVRRILGAAIQQPTE